MAPVLDIFALAESCWPRMATPWRWLGVIWVALAILSVHPPARAHDLAIDQVVLWPDLERRSMRGEITFDPELTRAKDSLPTAEHEAKVASFLADNLRYEVDGRELAVEYEIRELWVRGGATAGDLVVFSAPLPPGAQKLKVYASAAFKALVVTVTVAARDNPSQSRSWLLGRDSWTPDFPLDVPERATGWRAGGPEQFAPPSPEAPAVGMDPASPGVPGSAAPSALPEASSEPSRTSGGTTSGLAWRFVVLGFEHILPDGVDHMAFVAGLVLGALRRYKHILVSLTLFTVAHTVTLGLGNVTGCYFPPGIVEPLIAVSIAVVGLDNLRQARSPSTRPSRWRYAVVFVFGLIHGMGFANALTEMAFGGGDFLLGLLSFNVGVELGQLAVVGILLGALHWIQNPRHLHRYVVFPGSAAIAMLGFVFAIERLVATG
jgi:hypothetical protein